MNPESTACSTLAIIGPGQLGQSMARHAAECGLEVILCGRTVEHAQAAKERVIQRWIQARDAGRLSYESCADFSQRLQVAGAWDVAGGGNREGELDRANVIFEALPEDLDLKVEAWSRLSSRVSDHLLLTGSSALSAQSIRKGLGDKGQGDAFIQNFHPFVPVHRMRVVEWLAPQDTPLNLQERVQVLAQTLKLKSIHVSGTSLAASRMALAIGLESMRMLEAGVASAEDLDSLMQLGYHHPVGPLELSDRIGLDLRLQIARELFEQSGSAVFEPPQILIDKVQRFERGVKDARGFYAWKQEGGTMVKA